MYIIEPLLMHVATRKIAMYAFLLQLFITLILITQRIVQPLREKSKLDVFWNCHEPGKSRMENTHLRVQTNI